MAVTMNKASAMLMVVALVVLGMASLTTAASGVASFYTQYTPSACYGNQDMGNMIAAASDTFYNNGAACGKCYLVRCTGPANGQQGNPCTGNSVTVKIVDHCPSGCSSTIDLSQQAFAQIANLDAGLVMVTYDPTNNQTIGDKQCCELGKGLPSGLTSHLTLAAAYLDPPQRVGVCYGNRNMGNMIAAASDTFYNTGAACGKCYRVRCTGAAKGQQGNPCTGNSVTIKIVDYCPSGCSSNIDLSQQAFAKISNLDAGLVNVTYDLTGCP